MGKLAGMPQVTEKLPELIAADGFIPLPITHRHAVRAGGYPIDHRDPFDRMLAAQSELEAIALMTNDSAMSRFPCKTFW
jgi:PIN domain nuclease of toxin-antitoxin system